MRSFSWNVIALIVSLYVCPDDLGIKNTGSELFHFFLLITSVLANECMKDRIFEMPRKIWKHQ